MNNLFAEDSLSVFVQDSLPIQPLNAPTFGFMMIQMLGMLILISVVLYLSLYFFKKVNARFKNKNEVLCFKIHDNIYFSAKQGLSAVAFGDKLYIVGFSQNSVSLIDVIEDPDIVSKLTSVSPTPKGFGELLKGYFIKDQGILEKGK